MANPPTLKQLHLARALLHWSIARLAGAAGVHTNTIYNMEAGKRPSPATVAAVERAFVSAGVLFGIENDDSVMLRRSEVGDLVSLRLLSRVGLAFTPKIQSSEIGTVVDVEPHNAQVGSTYRISVRFSGGRLVPPTHRYEYELVKAVGP